MTEYEMAEETLLCVIIMEQDHPEIRFRYKQMRAHYASQMVRLYDQDTKGEPE